MRSFILESKCPKCGGPALTKGFCYFGPKGWFGRRREHNHSNKCTCSTADAHLCRDCSVCGASWPELPLDQVNVVTNSMGRNIILKDG